MEDGYSLPAPIRLERHGWHVLRSTAQAIDFVDGVLGERLFLEEWLEVKRLLHAANEDGNIVNVQAAYSAFRAAATTEKWLREPTQEPSDSSR